MRFEYEMTAAQLGKLLRACQPIPLVMLQCGMPPSPQDTANAAWEALGEEMGFLHMTVRPVAGKGDRFFTAEAKCSGIDLGDGNFSGCTGKGGDCPTCGK